MAAQPKESQAEVSVMSLMLSRVEEIAASTSLMASKMGDAITEIRKEIHEIDVQVTQLDTKMDSVIRTLGTGDDSLASNVVKLQTKMTVLEDELRLARDQASRVKMAWINSFLFPIFVGVVCSIVGWILVGGKR